MEMGALSTTLDGRAMLARFHQAHPEVPRDHRNLAPMVCWADGFITLYGLPTKVFAKMKAKNGL